VMNGGSGNLGGMGIMTTFDIDANSNRNSESRTKVNGA
jgi:hypothetical protein